MHIGDSYTEHLAIEHPHIYRDIIFKAMPTEMQERFVRDTFTFFE
jgi:hypothetical protein